MPRDGAGAELFEQLARIGKAVASPRRIELLDLLCQGERSVEALARTSRMSVTNTSQHLQALREARLVETRRDGVRIHYRLADDDVCRFFVALRDLARARLAEVERILAGYLLEEGEFEPVGRDELLERARGSDLLVLDVRPAEEYEAGHIPGAISIPLAELETRLGELPPRTEVVAYCRGPLCLLAPRAVELLRARGFRARRLEDGLPEWRLAGLPVATGTEGAP
ncbi:MAG: metalloregulator ArsR/SmtB family transcription factor [Thermoleophilia bacterium]|nr:metalloregulator ArsR/SmtB family transcription factor [Thermoleophilia bacterium]